jgi:hypothetical protein
MHALAHHHNHHLLLLLLLLLQPRRPHLLLPLLPQAQLLPVTAEQQQATQTAQSCGLLHPCS